MFKGAKGSPVYICLSSETQCKAFLQEAPDGSAKAVTLEEPWWHCVRYLGYMREWSSKGGDGFLLEVCQSCQAVFWLQGVLKAVVLLSHVRIPCWPMGRWAYFLASSKRLA